MCGVRWLAGPLIGIAEVLTVAYGGSQMRDFVVYGLDDLDLVAAPAGPARRRALRSWAARVMSTYYAGLLADIGILTLGALSVFVILATNQLSLGNAGFMGDRQLSFLVPDRERCSGR